MAEIRLQHNDNVRFVLQNETSSSFTMDQEPDGWKDDELELVRHQKYHGVFTQFTNSLRFYGGAWDFIKNSEVANGLNTNLYLIKYKLKKSGDDVKWVLDYMGLADFETFKENKNSCSLHFNSNDLEVIIKSHETDVFELERDKSIDGQPLSSLDINNVFLAGRKIIGVGESDVIEAGEYTNRITEQGTIKTKIISQGNERHSSVDRNQLNEDSTLEFPSNMFFVDQVEAGDIIDLDIEWDLSVQSSFSGSSTTIRVYFREYNFNGNSYDLDYEQEIGVMPNKNVTYNFKGKINRTVKPTNGYMIVFKRFGGLLPFFNIRAYKHNIKLGIISFLDGSNHDFVFINDAMSKLMEIVTGKQGKFYSKLFGRKITGRSSSDSVRRSSGSRSGRSNSSEFPKKYVYTSDGKYGLIGLVSGFWVRKFDPLSSKYKSMQLSIKDAIESLQAEFNVGVSIETVDLEQRLRIEDLKYYYQNEVGVELPLQVTDVERETDASLYFSGVEFGYQKGGDYENEIGLDEPNTKTSSTTPIRKTSNKYVKISKINSDGYGLEITRRKPQEQFPEEDTSRDEDNWFLDLKRTDGSSYNQVDWQDRLNELPEGVLSPETYRSFLFTPLRMMLRHGWIIRAGMEQALNLRKHIRPNNLASNKNLVTWFKDDPTPLGESEPIQADYLERSRFLPKIINFTHTVDDDLMDKLLGTSSILINGEAEDVPNVNMKIRFINEHGEKETGYLLELKPKTGRFKVQKANENIIF